MGVGDFIDRSNQRRLPEDYAGKILLWDIDKTYLDTEFSSWKGLLAIPFDLAVDKRAVPGTVPLLRALRRGTTARSALTPLYFVSGSPPQLRSVIERKMTLDGVEFDGITFKDQLGLVKARRFKDLKRQVGYKLKALLLYRRELPAAARWLMFGDDVESDADVFALFGRVCSGLRDKALDDALRDREVPEVDRHHIADLASTTPVIDNPIDQIFIHLSRKKSPQERGADPIVDTHSFLQTALLLVSKGLVKEDAIRAVAQSMRQRHITEDRIEWELEDARDRLGVATELFSWVRGR